MTRVDKLFALTLLASLGAWGCSQGPSGHPAGAQQIRSLEARLAKLEEDFRTAAASRDQLRHRLAASEEQRSKLEKDKEDLKVQVGTRTTERDHLQGQYEQFRKGIRELLGQAEAAAASPSQPVTVAVTPTSPGKS